MTNPYENYVSTILQETTVASIHTLRTTIKNGEKVVWIPQIRIPRSNHKTLQMYAEKYGEGPFTVTTITQASDMQITLTLQEVHGDNIDQLFFAKWD